MKMSWKLIRNQNIIIGIMSALLVIMEPRLGLQPADSTAGELLRRFLITYVIANIICLTATPTFLRIQGRGNRDSS